jgi:outer membrane protein TolC
MLRARFGPNICLVIISLLCIVAVAAAEEPPQFALPYGALPPQPTTAIPEAPLPQPLWSFPGLPIQPVLAPPRPDGPLQGPALSEGANPPRLGPPKARESDRPLPINLATALRLADARPLIIAAAQASVQQAAAQLDRAKVLWLPDLNAGVGNYLHLGGAQGVSGNQDINSRDSLLAGGGLSAVFATADAIFTPLALRQVLNARDFDVVTAQNDALMNVAGAYFSVQLARGRLAAAQDTVQKGQDLTRTIRGLSSDLASPIEIDRALTELTDLELIATSARQEWRTSSAGLTRVLRLDPSAVVDPLEPAFLQVTLFSPKEPVDALVPIGLTNRPELASQQALVQAALLRIKQEKIRPLIPSVVLSSNPTPVGPGGYLTGGAYYSEVHGGPGTWSGRFDPSLQVVWQLQNLGFGNAAAVRERRAENQRALVELFRLQDQVAAEVVEAHADLESAAERATQAEFGLKEAMKSFEGNLKGLGQTTRFNDRLTLVVRPQEAVVSLRQLGRSFNNYFQAVRDYNQAQFRLYRALGYPARALTCDRPVGEVKAAAICRPREMAP